MNNKRGDRRGFGPVPGAPDSGLYKLSRARREVLEILAHQPEPCTAGHIAAALHQHHNTIREHLDGLRLQGFVERTRGPAEGRGRPPWLYHATIALQDPPSEYAGLAAALAGQIARSSADPLGDAMAAGRVWGTELARTRSHEVAEDSPDSADFPVRQVVELLDVLGYSPEGEGEEILLRRCPLLAAANQHPEIVCHVHQGLVEGALEVHGASGIDVEIVPFAEPGACHLHLRTEKAE